METEKQDQFAIKLTKNAQARRLWPNEPDRIIETHGYVATALRKVAMAGTFGVHIDEFRRDALARFEQQGISYVCFAAHKRGTGDAPCWVRLAFNDWFDISLIGSAA